MKQIIINFGGFYCSVHDSLIDSMLDSYYQDENGETLDYYSLDINYKTIFEAYSKQYLKTLEAWLHYENDVTIEFDFKSLQSPREYNFSTDKIIASISNASHKKLINKFKKDVDFIAYLKEATQSRPGYISFYSFDDAINDKDNVLSDYLTSYLCNKFNADDYLDYYDRNNGYELLYGLNMPQLENEAIS